MSSFIRDFIGLTFFLIVRANGDLSKLDAPVDCLWTVAVQSRQRR